MADMGLGQDFLDLLACLGDAGAEHVLVGGYAMNVHGVVRATEDLDVFVGRATENLQRVAVALSNFGAPPMPEIAVLQGATEVPAGFRFGRAPIRVDVLTVIAGGAPFAAVWASRIIVSVGGLEVPVMSLDELRANKRAAGRLKDLADLQALDEIYGPPKS